MKAADFAPGTRVRHAAKGITGTVDPDAVDARTRRDYPGMVPVRWDGDDAWLTAPAYLAVVVEAARVFPPSSVAGLAAIRHRIVPEVRGGDDDEVER
ncbi:hypothetical protein [Cellulosimicrobium cellulans]|uniref:hypothetical protein n=1 Tax=Cellulosimicrobium cellulans TaxID=1710 RepID=UPI0024055B97|nr:hypothetical protein [Cellulosimicrobium cellulans]MDF9876162.1 hypothetical protein [Cellulosimicrobium cellulans]